MAEVRRRQAQRPNETPSKTGTVEGSQAFERVGLGPLRKIYPPPRDRPPGLTPEQIQRMMNPDGDLEPASKNGAQSGRARAVRARMPRARGDPPAMALRGFCGRLRASSGAGRLRRSRPLRRVSSTYAKPSYQSASARREHAGDPKPGNARAQALVYLRGSFGWSSGGRARARDA